MNALQIAASGMQAQEVNVEVLSNNIANMRTTGFKRQRAEFADLLYQNLRRMGTDSSDSGTVVPTGSQVGSGVRLTATARIMSQGSLLATQKPLDLAILGEGYFRIQLPDGRTAYTRDGSFERSATGTLVTIDGYTVGQGITIPQNARDITVNAQGLIQAMVGNASTATTLGRLELSTFVNGPGLEAIGNNLMLETAASGPAQIANPGDPGLGTLLQGNLEMSNVNPVSEISELIAAQRAYEMNSRVIKAVDEMLSSTANIR
jgi:flagellar basal-body rod protein FlgG